MAQEFEVQGLKELYATMNELPVKVEKNIMRGMIRAAAKPIYEEARRRAPVLQSLDPRRVFGALAKSIHIRSVQVKNGNVVGGVAAGGTAKVGRGKNKVEADAFYARFVEYGTVKTPAQAFMRPAIDTKTPEAIAAGAEYAKERVEAGDATT